MKVEKVENVDKQHEISMRSCLWKTVRNGYVEFMNKTSKSGDA